MNYYLHPEVRIQLPQNLAQTFPLLLKSIQILEVHTLFVLNSRPHFISQSSNPPASNTTQIATQETRSPLKSFNLCCWLGVVGQRSKQGRDKEKMEPIVDKKQMGSTKRRKKMMTVKKKRKGRRENGSCEKKEKKKKEKKRKK